MPVHVGALAGTGNSLISFKIIVHRQIFCTIVKIFIFSNSYFSLHISNFNGLHPTKEINRHKLKKGKGGGGVNPISTVFPFLIFPHPHSMESLTELLL